MAEVTYEIQRESNGGFGMCRARVKSQEEAIKEVELMLKEFPKQRLRIIERTERVILLTDKK